MPRASNSGKGVDEVTQRACETVELPHGDDLKSAVTRVGHQAIHGRLFLPRASSRALLLAARLPTTAMLPETQAQTGSSLDYSCRVW